MNDQEKEARITRAGPSPRAGGRRPHPELVRAVVLLKKAAALANRSVGSLSETIALAIVDAADEALWETGRLDRYIGDRFRAGSGALLDAEVNQALAARANVLLVGGGGDRAPVRASEHVGLSQSPDLVIPAATRVAVLWGWEVLQAAFEGLSGKSLAQEDTNRGHRPQLSRAFSFLADAAADVLGRGLCSAVRSGGASSSFRAACAHELGLLTGWDMENTADTGPPPSGADDLLRFSAALRTLALEIAGKPPSEFSEGGDDGSARDGATRSSRALEMAAYVVTGADLAVSLASLDAAEDLDVFTVVLGDLIPSNLRLLANVVHATLRRRDRVRPDEGVRPPSPLSLPMAASAPADTTAAAFAPAPAEIQAALQASIANERRRVSQLQVLNQLAVVLNSERDAGRMLDQVLRGAAQLTGARSGSLYLAEPTGLRLEAFTTSSAASRSTDAQPAPGVEARELARRVVRERHLVRLVQEVGGKAGRGVGFLAAPLVAVDGELFGSFVLTGAAEGGFSTEDEMLAQTLAAHVAVALQNLRRLEHEQRVAEYLQRSMLPRIPRIPGLELEVTYQSAFDQSLVGGDFYDVIDVGRRHVALAVGDVCGKGLVAATQMTMVRHMLRAHASLDIDPGAWLSLVNESMERNLGGAEFVTVALVVVDASTGILDYAMAGHPPPLLAASSGTWDLSGEPGLPLGVKKGGMYKSHRAFMPKGATLFLYTDGLYEARVNGHLFGTEKLHAVAHDLGATVVRGGPSRLVEEARAFAGGRLVDDVVVLEARLSAE
jgi:serine phosphatase RsbU (regulator of sigma subunit)